MADDGKTVPRPPRRVPPSDGMLTQLENSTPEPPPPPRQPWIFGRILAGFIVLLIIIAGGAYAGWWIRSQRASADPGSDPASGPSAPASTPTVRLDATTVTALAGPAVIRVLATTCAGTGEASGALIEGGKILTAASAIREPLSIVIVTADGRIRRANLLGTSADGVAVLQLVGRINGTPLKLAATAPDPNAERAMMGYTAAGTLAVQNLGTPAQPTELSKVMNAAKLGGPVVGKSGEVIGTVVGDTVPESRIIGADKLRGYVARGAPGLTTKLGDCPRSRGPQTPVAPELQVARTQLAVEAQRLLASYYTLENQHDFEAVQKLYSNKLSRTMTVNRDRRSHQTSYFFLPKITGVTRTGTDRATARVSFNVLFSPGVKGSGGQACNRLDNRYDLVRVNGELLIDQSVAMSKSVACESD